MNATIFHPKSLRVELKPYKLNKWLKVKAAKELLNIFLVIQNIISLR